MCQFQTADNSAAHAKATKVSTAVTICYCLTFTDPLGLHIFMYKFLFLLSSHLNRASWSTIRNKLSQAKPSPAAQAHGTVTGQPHTWGQVGLFSGFLFCFPYSVLIALLFITPLPIIHPHTVMQMPAVEVKMTTLACSSNTVPIASTHPFSTFVPLPASILGTA